MALTYAAVTPARDEAANLPRLAGCLAAQTVPPVAWIVVDNGSRDGTLEFARTFAADHPWASALEVPGSVNPVRGAPIVQAIHAGLAALGTAPDVFVNIDADVSFDPGYFEALLAAFEEDPKLGIASGACFELDGGEWKATHVTGSTVRGATRAYRWACLQGVLPLEERLAWDGVDELKANAAGWRTGVVHGLRFLHHRRVGERDRSRWRRWAEQGRASHYLGYRGWYLAARAVFNARRDPASLAMIWGYAAAAVTRTPRLPDPAARAYLRSQQRLRNLHTRAREAGGRHG